MSMSMPFPMSMSMCLSQGSFRERERETTAEEENMKGERSMKEKKKRQAFSQFQNYVCKVNFRNPIPNWAPRVLIWICFPGLEYVRIREQLFCRTSFKQHTSLTSKQTTQICGNSVWEPNMHSPCSYHHQPPDPCPWHPLRRPTFHFRTCLPRSELSSFSIT